MRVDKDVERGMVEGGPDNQIQVDWAGNEFVNGGALPLADSVVRLQVGFQLFIRQTGYGYHLGGGVRGVNSIHQLQALLWKSQPRTRLQQSF
jgi:hypothetical protein